MHKKAATTYVWLVNP